MFRFEAATSIPNQCLRRIFKPFLKPLKMAKGALAYHWFLTPVLALSACQKGTPVELVTSGPSKDAKVSDLKTKKGSEKQIASNEKQSLIIEKHPSKKLLRLKKSALGKEFLLTTSILENGATPRWFPMIPNIVYFEKQGDQILMFAKNSYAIYESVDAPLLLQKFKIHKEILQAIVFDLGPGVETFLLGKRPKLNDVDLERDLGALAVAVLTNSSVSRFSESEEVLSIEQVGKMKLNKNNQRISISDDFEIGSKTHIELQPYRTRDEFQKIEYSDSTSFGYQKVATSVPGLKNQLNVFIQHWDFSADQKPIQILLTSNTPKRYLDVILEGVSYWTKMIGAEKFKIITDVDPGIVPPLRSIFIRWVEFEDATTAWAVNQADPRTGEILRAQVALTSFWVKIPGSVQALKQDGETSKNELSLFGSLKACELPSKNFVSSAPISNERTAEMYMHRFRSTVAHELGHAFGLSHNFAASFNVSSSSADLLRAREDFLSSPLSKAPMTANSVMDYFSSDDDFSLGSYIKHDVLPYDNAAIRFSMSADQSLLGNPQFASCSDEDLQEASQKGFHLYGCAKYDVGVNPFVTGVHDTQKKLSGLFSLIFEATVLNMNLDSTSKFIPMSEMLNKWTPEVLIGFIKSNILDDLDKLKSHLYMESKNKAAMAFGSPSILYSVFEKHFWDQKDFAKTATSDRMGSDFVEAGGLVAIMKSFLPLSKESKLDLDFFDKQIESLAKSERFKSGKTVKGQNYSLSDDEQQMLIKFFQIIKADINKLLLDYLIALIPDEKIAFNKLIQNNKWYPELGRFAAGLFLSTKEFRNFAVGTKIVSLPSYDLEPSVRNASTKIFDANAFGSSQKLDQAEALKSASYSNLQKVLQAAYEYEALKNGELRNKKKLPLAYADLFEEINRLSKLGIINQQLQKYIEADLSLISYFE